MRKIIIKLDKDHTPEDTVYRVYELLEEGFICGIDPTWEIVEE
jgi:hypothetical protein